MFSLEFMIDVVAKATALLLLMVVIDKLLVRSSAAMRHRLWGTTFVALLILPLLCSVLPQWRLAVLPTHWTIAEATAKPSQALNEDTPNVSQRSSSGPPIFDSLESVDQEAFASVALSNNINELSQETASAGDIPPQNSNSMTLGQAKESMAEVSVGSAPAPSLPIGAAWLLGLIVVLSPFAYGVLRNAKLKRASQLASGDGSQSLVKELCGNLGIHRQVTLLETEQSIVPMTWGVLRPIVIVPRIWQSWLPESRRLVLMHELAHIKRFDVAYQLLGRFACSLYWFHPLFWYGLRRLRIERELACDDCVLMAGEKPSSYAKQLLEIAKNYQLVARPPAIAMAQSSGLEQRVRSLLDKARSHVPIRTSTGRALLIGFVAATSLLAIVQLDAVAVRPQEVTTSDADQVATAAMQATPAATSNATPTMEPVEDAAFKVVRGTITDVDGQPSEGAFVAVVGFRIVGGMWTNSEVLGEAITDREGRFELSFSGVSSATHRNSQLIARTDDSAISWQLIDLDASESEVELALQDQELIQVRLVDLEGRPASVEVRVENIISGNRDIPGDGIQLARVKSPPKAAWPILSTNADGLLRIPSIPAGHGVYLEVVASDTFAPQGISINSGASEERGENDGTYRAITKNMQPGEIATIPISPAQHFEGVVLLGDTGLPAKNARVSIWASQQEEFGSMVSVEGRTDTNGHFRLNPHPGVRFGITAYPPKGQPYQLGRLDDLRWNSGPASKNIEIRLDLGMIARGKVIDAVTGQPLVKASVQYHPDRVNNPNLNDNVVTGWQSLLETDAAGNFDIPVLPGPGTLLVHAATSNYILQQVGSREIESGRQGGRRTYAHAFVKIDPVMGDEFDTLNVSLQPGKSVTATIVDPQGKHIDQALVISRLKILASNSRWRGFPDTAFAGNFEIKGLAEGEEYPVYFLDAENQLGASAIISTKTPSPTVVLQPCGSATAKFVYDDGNPVEAGLRLSLSMVMTNGKS